MRLFVGIEFPSETVEILVKCREQLRCSAAKGRFKRSENFHLTLKFLGEVEPLQVPALTSALAGVARATSPFSLRLGRLGKFGKGNPTRVVWMDVVDNDKYLGSLQSKIETVLANLGFKSEPRSWQPHVTLAQDVEFVGRETLCIDHDKGAVFVVSEFVLFLSEEQDRRRVYTALHRFSFARV